MKRTRVLFKAVLAVSFAGGMAPSAAAQHQPTTASIERAAEVFAAQEARQILGPTADVTARATPLDQRLRLPVCPEMTPSSVSGSARWGKTTVQITCSVPRWRMYLSVIVSAKIRYPVAAAPQPAGHLVEPGDLTSLAGDISELPSDLVIDERTVVGRKLVTGVPLGKPFRASYFQRKNAVTAGQRVKLVLSGNGFSITSEGTATNSATEGGPVRVIGPNAKTVTGIAHAVGTVEATWE
jgi:flagella basal body P-ring formation protein FlgA